MALDQKRPIFFALLLASGIFLSAQNADTANDDAQKKIPPPTEEPSVPVKEKKASNRHRGVEVYHSQQLPTGRHNLPPGRGDLSTPTNPYKVSSNPNLDVNSPRAIPAPNLPTATNTDEEAVPEKKAVKRPENKVNVSKHYDNGVPPDVLAPTEIPRDANPSFVLEKDTYNKNDTSPNGETNNPEFSLENPDYKGTESSRYK